MPKVPQAEAIQEEIVQVAEVQLANSVPAALHAFPQFSWQVCIGLLAKYTVVIQTPQSEVIDLHMDFQKKGEK